MTQNYILRKMDYLLKQIKSYYVQVIYNTDIEAKSDGIQK